MDFPARKRDPWTIAAILAFAAGMFALLFLDARPLNRAEAEAYLRSAALLDALAGPRGGVGAFLRAALLAGDATPPGVALLQLPFLALAKRSVLACLPLNLAGVAAVCFGMVTIGKALYGRASAWTALFLLLTMPSLVYLATRPVAAFPVLALSVLTVAAFLRLEWSENGLAAIVVGALLGLGCLCSPAFPLYVAGPIGWCLWERRRQATGPLKWRAVPAPLAVAALVAGPWYGLNAGVLAHETAAAFSENSHQLFGITYLQTTFIQLWNVDFHGVLTIFVVLCLAAASEADNLRAVGLPVLWIGVPLAVLTFLPWKDLGLLVPAYPGLALLAASGLSGMKKRAYVVLLVAAAVVFQTIGMVNVYGERDLPLSGLNRGKGTEASERYAPQRTGWGIVKMAEAIRDAATAPPDAPPTPGAARIACLPDLPYLNAATLAAHVAATGVPARPVDLADPDLRVRRLRLAEADFIVESDGYQGPKERTAGNDELRDGLKRADLAGRSALRQIGAYPLPDGSTAWLLTRESGGR